MAGTDSAAAPEYCTNPAQSAPGCSQDVPTGGEENPGALAGAAGAIGEVDKLRPADYLAASPVASRAPLPGTWNRSRFRWLRLITRKKDMVASVKVVAGIIVNEATDRLTGACFYTIAQFAEAAGMSEDTVKRAFRCLEAEHFLCRRPVTGRGNRSRFAYQMPDRRAAAYVLDPHSTDAGQGAQSDAARAGADAQVVPLLARSRAELDPPDGPRKGCTGAPRYINQRKPKLRAPMQAPARETAPMRTGAEPPRGMPERLRLNLATAAYHGSDRESAWNNWLRSRGFPILAQLGVKSCDAGGIGWEVPSRQPPTADDGAIEHLIAHQWAEWAAARMEDRHVL